MLKTTATPLAHQFFAGLVLLCFLSYTSQSAFALEPQDLELLKKIQKDSFQYFLVYSDPETGLTLDSSRSGSPASIAATGFALAAISVASTNGWLSYREAYQRIDRTLNTLEHKAAKKNGFFYHFLDPKTGNRAWGSEVSSIDTALLMAGVLIAAASFRGTEIETRARKLYEEVDWPWMLNNTFLFAHGWKPDQGFLPYYWDTYSEHLILQALALGSETHPVPEQVWEEWERRKDSYNGTEIVYSYTGSLFTYQFPHAFIDFRDLNDREVNYATNSEKATVANQEFCALHSAEFESYQQERWGLSACLGPDGYKAYGAEPGIAYHDGTIAVHASIGSIVFTPEASTRMIRTLYDEFGDQLYGRFGFKGSFNLDRNWWANEYLAIDQGLIVLMLENYLHDGAVWMRFMSNPEIERWVKRTNLKSAA